MRGIWFWFSTLLIGRSFASPSLVRRVLALNADGNVFLLLGVNPVLLTLFQLLSWSLLRGRTYWAVPLKNEREDSILYGIRVGRVRVAG